VVRLCYVDDIDASQTQYSQYFGKVVTTSATSAIPVATIGGEPGGRAPIVVEDKVQKDPKDLSQNDHTSVAEGQAEPGPNIFASGPAKDIQSQGNPAIHAPKLDIEPSSIVTTSSTAAMDTEKKMATDAKFPAESSLSSPTNSQPTSDMNADSSRTADPTQESGTTSSERTEIRKPVGPLPEAAAEADRAANELFPDAAKQK
jgi:dolichyl-phosphate-mannose-protein mannosyltransferase